VVAAVLLVMQAVTVLAVVLVVAVHLVVALQETAVQATRLARHHHKATMVVQAHCLAQR
jgi:hypothetical protein